MCLYVQMHIVSMYKRNQVWMYIHKKERKDRDSERERERESEREREREREREKERKSERERARERQRETERDRERERQRERERARERECKFHYTIQTVTSYKQPRDQSLSAITQQLSFLCASSSRPVLSQCHSALLHSQMHREH